MPRQYLNELARIKIALDKTAPVQNSALSKQRLKYEIEKITEAL